MAANILSKNTNRFVFYASSMRAIVNKLRLNARSMTTITMKHNLASTETSMSPSTHWPHDPHFPLPGNVAVDLNNLGEAESLKKQNYQSLASAFMHLENDTLKKQNILSQFIHETGKVEENITTAVENSTNNKVECKIQNCPPMLKKGIEELFSGIPANSDDLTIITISQETVNDMAGWSEEVDEEREMLMGLFVENAKELCQKLSGGGYWADFVDPCSGQAFYSEHRNGSLFETDDRFNQLGFELEDLGCCKVLRHKQWQTNVFVGVIVTNAPSESDVFQNV